MRRDFFTGGPLGRVGLLGLLVGCTDFVPVAPICDPRVLNAGEVRARQLLCTDELIPGGEARVGDWVLENSVARFALRGTYAALYSLDDQGGTLVDAVALIPEADADDGSASEASGGDGDEGSADVVVSADVLGEIRVEGDRSSIVAVNDGGTASLVLPGMTWTLTADDAVLRLSEASAATIHPRPGVARTGRSWPGASGGILGGILGGFLGTDGSAEDGLSAAVIHAEITFVTADSEAWTAAQYGSAEAVLETVDADTVAVERDGTVLTRLPVTDGVVSGWAPEGATLRCEREGCTYDGLTQTACGFMHVRVRDDAGNDLVSSFYTDSTRWVLPAGGGVIPGGLEPFVGTLWAGPAYGYTALTFTPGTDQAVTLRREMNTEGAVLADLRRAVAPDVDVAWASPEAAHDASGDGVGFVVVYADDEVPSASVAPEDTHERAADGAYPLFVTAGVRSQSADGGTVLSWPWSANSKRAAHGAPERGWSALDLLTLVRNNSADRRTVVDAAWVQAALAEAPVYAWFDRPLAVWLDDADAMAVYFDLLEHYVPVTPVGPRTWIELPNGDRNIPGIEAGLYAGQTTAGNGPRIEASDSASLVGDRLWRVQVDASRWMGVRALTVWTPEGSRTLPLSPIGPGLGGGYATFHVPEDIAWLAVSVAGDDGIWAVRGL